jgi:hypothetical protein
MKNTNRKPIIVNIGLLKRQIQGLDCLVIGFHWIFEPHPVVESVITNPVRTKNFVDNLKKVIDRKKYRVKCYPNENQIESISVSTFLNINSLNRDILYRAIINVWLQYLSITRQLDRASGRKKISNPSDYV